MTRITAIFQFGRKGATAALLGSTALISASPALAQATEPVAEPVARPASPSSEETIVVTAQRRAENLQDVPIAITAITTKTLEQLQVSSFEDYARLVPSLSMKSGGGGGSSTGPGTNNAYFRGVSSGDNANHSASLPSVGSYLDEQPITTVSGALDIHVFDIARVEALAGPQGTLYGASSEAGTIRIITNKPDFTRHYGETDLEVNKVSHGDFGFAGEGFVNAPLSTSVASRLVAWYQRDGGYIDNVPGTLTFANSGITINNYNLAKNDYNDVDIFGGRAALKILLDETWTVSPTLMGQKELSHGSFAQETGLGDLETMQFNPERVNDRWYQGAVTVDGEIGGVGTTYAGSYMRRHVNGSTDYSDYSYFYDYTFADNNGDFVNPNQFIENEDKYTKLSHELRFATDNDRPIRLVGGLFYQRQTHNILQDYIIEGISDAIKVPGTESDIWLTKQLRTDRDYAVFGEVSYDFTPTLSATAGGRYYKYKNSLLGFFGFNYPGQSSNPDYACQGPPQLNGAPCTNVDKTTKGSGFLHRLNLTYKPNKDMLFYGTWSRGFRPGGVNRRGSLPPYKADFVTNFELGTKLSFLQDRVRLNLAVYRLDWRDIQLSFLGVNGLTEVRNAGDARIYGSEVSFYARPMTGLTLDLGAAITDAKIRNDYCSIDPPTDCDAAAPDEILARKGDRLPVTARFKGSGRVRYEWPVGSMTANVQLSASYESSRRRDLRREVSSIYGTMKGYSQVDLSGGLATGPWKFDLYAKNLFDTRGVTSKGIQCNEFYCGDPDNVTAIGGKIYDSVIRPRTIGFKVGHKF